MGCDINMYIEGRTRKECMSGSDKWYSMDYFVKTDYGYDVKHIYDNRNYQLFALLADVRNYGDITPIKPPIYDIPSDSCDIIKAEYEDGFGDIHSTTYYTLKELQDYIKLNPTMKWSGILSPEQQRDLDEKGVLPTSWCQGTNMEGYERREWEEPIECLNYLIDVIKERTCDFFRIYDFYDDGKKEEKINNVADDVRIVFWFDN